MSTRSKKSASTADSLVDDIAAAFLIALDNDEIVTKLATALSASISLTLTEKLTPISLKLDQLVNENKILRNKVSDIESENIKLKQLHDGLQTTVDNLAIKVKSSRASF